METNKLMLFSYFPSFQDSDEFFQKIIDESNAGRRIFSQLLLLCLFFFLYGIVMGAFHSVAQALVAGVKVAVLVLLALLICFPAFYIVQYILGSRLKLFQMVTIVLSGFILMGALMLSFAPIVIIFLLTGSNYYFLQLLHIAIFIFAGFFGMNTIVRALKFSCEKKNVYPQTGVAVFRVWVVILAFVGVQLAWNFRPFLGDRGQPFELFRQYEGNFYTALIYSVKKLVEPEEKENGEPSAKYKPDEYDEYQEVDTTYLKALFGDTGNGN